MRVLVACEYSGIVRDAFAARGHDAWSCDLLETERPGQHIQGDIRAILASPVWKWDLMIAHPPCTFLTNAANRWLTDPRYPNRIQDRAEAIQFFKLLLETPIEKICVENPVPNGALTQVVGKYTQTIQPYNFGEDASKRTCLWLKGLPKLENTDRVSPRVINGKLRWGNQSPSGADSRGPSPDRWKERSRTFQGIANAMAEQWG